jgi:hypothetical protein
MFGSTPVGQPITFNLTVHNLGDEPLKLYNPSIEGGNPADFKIASPAFPVTVAPGNSQVLVLQCSPTAPGTRQSSLIFDVNDEDWLVVEYYMICNGVGGAVAGPAAQLRVSPDRVASRNSEISFNFTVNALGDTDVLPTVRFPIDPALKLQYASNFSDSGMWVSAIVTDGPQPYVQVTLPADPQGSFSGSLVFRPVAGVKAGTVTSARYTVSWESEDGWQQLASNAVRFSLDNGTARNDTNGEVQLFAPAVAKAAQGSTFNLSGDFYSPGEIVTFWYTNKEGQSVEVGQQQADDSGKVSLSLKLKDFEAGETYVVAGYGNRSGVTGSSVLTIS